MGGLRSDVQGRRYQCVTSDLGCASDLVFNMVCIADRIAGLNISRSIILGIGLCPIVGRAAPVAGLKHGGGRVSIGIHGGNRHPR